jgi:hypothetical protein
VCDRHFRYYDAFSEKMWDAVRSADMLTWRSAADDETENLRAAVEWGMQHHPESALHLAANYCIVSSFLGVQGEGLALLKSALDRFHSLGPAEDDALFTHRQRILAKALFARGLISMTGADESLGMQSLEAAIYTARLIGDKQILGYCLELYYIASSFINPPGKADAEAAEGYAILSEINDQWGLGLAYTNMARMAFARGDAAESQKFINILKRWMQDAQLSYMTGVAFLSIGSEIRAAHPESAREYYEEALKIFRHLRHKGFEPIMLSELGHVARTTGKTAEAKELYRQSLRHFHDQGNRPAIAHELECFAFLAIADEEPQRAAHLLGAAEALRERIKASMQYMEHVEYDDALVRLRSMLTEAELDSLWTEGRAFSMEQAIKFALS